MAKSQGTVEIQYNVPIDPLFLYYYGSTEKMKVRLQNMVSNDPVFVTDDVVGSIYRRAYDLPVIGSSLLPQHESTQVQEIARKEYDTTIMDFLDTPDQKKVTESYTMDKHLTIQTEYYFKKVDEQTTSLQYTYSYTIHNWIHRLLFRLNTRFDPSVVLQDTKERIELDFLNDRRS